MRWPDLRVAWHGRVEQIVLSSVGGSLYWHMMKKNSAGKLIAIVGSEQVAENIKWASREDYAAFLFSRW